ncbi:cbb3-type cytochrome c oxidase subunit I [Pelobacter seleniigenes]|uniref:cbb3-type cytochrome c oxidase subunit I n=1 Tax=Pelobacter seleniigenes TaxID=407188 RepID=UPI0004A718A3|nr:cbb3-type cytochrome c oxidase subunit I [Pelobacter seleniigenes]
MSGTLEHQDTSAKIFFAATIFWFAIFTGFGFILAIKFFQPTFLGSTEVLTFGRIRPAHINGVLFGFLSSGLLGAMFYILPRLCKTELRLSRLASLAAIVWNISVLIGIAMILSGNTQGREYAEMPWFIDVLVVLALLIFAVVTFSTLRCRQEKKLYVSLWYYAGTMLWFPVVYVIGNVMWKIPEGALNGTTDAIFNWYYGHNVLGLWFTTLGIPAWYYLVPKLTRRPLYSHLLSIIAFFSIAFFYTGVGGHHLLQAPIPEWLKTIAVIMSLLMLVPVVTFATNIMLTCRGHVRVAIDNLPLRWALTGFLFYVLASVQGSFQALRSTNAFTHFSQWPVGHAHLALLGGFGFLVVGLAYWLVPKMLSCKIYSTRLMSLSWWLATIGFSVFFLAMTIAGLVANSSWWVHVDLVATLPMLRPHFIIRAIGGGMVVLGAWVYAFNLLCTFLHLGAAKAQTEQPDEIIQTPQRKHPVQLAPEKINLTVVIVGGMVLFVVMTFMVVGMPYMYAAMEPSATAHPYSQRQTAGHELFKNLGCFYCHSQFTRPQDWAGGEVSQRGDYFYDTPHLLGTERTGPNLAKIGGKRPTQWHKRHHTDPRSVSPTSIMPPFAFLSEEELGQLADYLQHLGTEDLELHSFQPQPPPELRDKMNPYMKPMMMAAKGYDPQQQTYSGNPAIGQKWATVFEQGKTLYAQKCLPCHGGSGNGRGVYARMLVTRPANLHERITNYPSPDAPFHFWRIWAGVPGTGMPAWGQQLDDDQIWHLSTYEMALANGTPRTVSDDISDQAAIAFANQRNEDQADIKGTQEEYRHGAKLFAAYCRQCHGSKGMGNGDASSTAGGYVKPEPANFHETGDDFRMNGQYLYKIREGVPTTNMPPWKEALSDEEIAHLTYFIQSFAAPKDWQEKWRPLYADAYAMTIESGGKTAEPLVSPKSEEE